MERDALYACLVAFAAAALLTPLVGALRAPDRRRRRLKARGLASEATPLLGGLAIFARALIAGLLFMPDNERTRGILAAAALITLVGALDDVLRPPARRQARAASCSRR